MSVIYYPWNKVDQSKLQIGDHIYSFRSLHSYTHHGEDRVIHFSRTEAPKTNCDWLPSSSSSSVPASDGCKNCGHNRKSERGVIKTCVGCFLNGHRHIFRFKYGASSLRFFLDMPGACSTKVCEGSKAVVERAEEMFRRNGFGDYDLWKNNCECFAVYCKTGQGLSLQAVYQQAVAAVAVDGAAKALLNRNLGCLVKAGFKIFVVPKYKALQRDKMVHGHRPC